MRDLAKIDSQKREIRNLANWLNDPLGLDQYLRHYWRIVPDPDHAELVREPLYQVQEMERRGFFTGDCDDAATLAASVLHAMGCAASLIAIRVPGDVDFSHVFCRSWFYGSAVDIDPIVPESKLPIEVIIERMEVSVL